jgi:hypothetical protein
MAFCSACGAQMTGPFCGRCGAPASATAQAAQPSPPQPQPQSQQPPLQPSYQAPPQVPPFQAQPYQGQPMGMPPGAKKTSPIVWILAILGGLVILGILVVGLAVSFFMHKARQAGLDPELLRSNPGLAISKMAAMSNPDIQVLDTNDREGTITVRDRKTGKVSKLTFDEVKNGHFNLRVQEDGKESSLNFGGNETAKMPSWVPAYSGSNVKIGFSATNSGENGDAGNFTFITSDSPDVVRAFYESKARDANMEVKSTASYGTTTVVTFTDSATRHTMTVTIVAGNPTGVSLFYSTK